MEKPSKVAAKKRTKDETAIINDAYILTDKQKKIGLNKTYFLKTYGCQANERDSQTISAILEEMGYTPIEDYEKANLILLNTCAIRENVHDKVFGFLGRVKHLRETKPEVIVGLCGCMAQEEEVVENIEKKYSWMNFIFGTHNIHRIPSLLEEAIRKNTLEIEVLSKEGEVYENLPVKREHPFKAFVNIMYGCDKFCTYCIVPYTRGKQRSRLPLDIIKEVTSLVELGYQEVTLLGQNVNAYGKDLKNNNIDMAKLLELVAQTRIPRIRFVTSHPWDFSKDMLEIMAKYHNIMPYIHLPVQSGSNHILKLMGRRYTKETYLKLVASIRKTIPNASITTDIIVGFPNESDIDFNDTLELVDQVGFDGAFTFIYSPREGTPAAKMVDNIGKDIKEKRLMILNKLVNSYSLKNNQKLLNKTVQVLIESTSEKNKDLYMGYTDTMKLVNVKCAKEDLGKIINVKIIEAKSFSLNGEKVL